MHIFIKTVGGGGNLLVSLVDFKATDIEGHILQTGRLIPVFNGFFAVYGWISVDGNADLGVAEGIGLLPILLPILFDIIEVYDNGMSVLAIGVLSVVDAKIQDSSVIVVTELVHKSVRMRICCPINFLGIEHHAVIMGQQG